MKLLILIPMVLLLLGCKNTRDTNGLSTHTRSPSKCINGFQYFDYYKGASLYLSTEGLPVRCSMGE